jgi:hypothetical protein
VIPTTSPEAAATSHLISQLRDSVIPAAEHGTTLRVYVGGVTAINGDFATVIAPKLLIFIAVIFVLGFLLLMPAFRSLLIPAVAAVMNLLAAAASFGVLVAVFQYGWGLRLLNLGQASRSSARSASAWPPPSCSTPSSCAPLESRPHAPVRPRQLVAARLARPHPPAPVHRTRLRTTRPAPTAPASQVAHSKAAQ